MDENSKKLYSYCKAQGYEGSPKEFEQELSDLIVEEIDNKGLSKIAGGNKLTKATIASLVSALSVASPFASAAQTMQSDSHTVMSTLNKYKNSIANKVEKGINHAKENQKTLKDILLKEVLPIGTLGLGVPALVGTGIFIKNKIDDNSPDGKTRRFLTQVLAQSFNDVAKYCGEASAIEKIKIHSRLADNNYLNCEIGDLSTAERICYNILDGGGNNTDFTSSTTKVSYNTIRKSIADEKVTEKGGKFDINDNVINSLWHYTKNDDNNKKIIDPNGIVYQCLRNLDASNTSRNKFFEDLRQKIENNETVQDSMKNLEKAVNSLKQSVEISQLETALEGVPMTLSTPASVLRLSGNPQGVDSVVEDKGLFRSTSALQKKKDRVVPSLHQINNQINNQKVQNFFAQLLANSIDVFTSRVTGNETLKLDVIKSLYENFVDYIDDGQITIDDSAIDIISDIQLKVVKPESIQGLNGITDANNRFSGIKSYLLSSSPSKDHFPANIKGHFNIPKVVNATESDHTYPFMIRKILTESKNTELWKSLASDLKVIGSIKRFEKAVNRVLKSTSYEEHILDLQNTKLLGCLPTDRLEKIKGSLNRDIQEVLSRNESDPEKRQLALANSNAISSWIKGNLGKNISYRKDILTMIENAENVPGLLNQTEKLLKYETKMIHDKYKPTRMYNLRVSTGTELEKLTAVQNLKELEESQIKQDVQQLIGILQNFIDVQNKWEKSLNFLNSSIKNSHQQIIEKYRKNLLYIQSMFSELNHIKVIKNCIAILNPSANSSDKDAAYSALMSEDNTIISETEQALRKMNLDDTRGSDALTCNQIKNYILTFLDLIKCTHTLGDDKYGNLRLLTESLEDAISFDPTYYDLVQKEEQKRKEEDPSVQEGLVSQSAKPDEQNGPVEQPNPFEGTDLQNPPPAPQAAQNDDRQEPSVKPTANPQQAAVSADLQKSQEKSLVTDSHQTDSNEQDKPVAKPNDAHTQPVPAPKPVEEIKKNENPVEEKKEERKPAVAQQQMDSNAQPTPEITATKQQSAAVDQISSQDEIEEKKTKLKELLKGKLIEALKKSHISSITGEIDRYRKTEPPVQNGGLWGFFGSSKKEAYKKAHKVFKESLNGSNHSFKENTIRDAWIVACNDIQNGLGDRLRSVDMGLNRIYKGNHVDTFNVFITNISNTQNYSILVENDVTNSNEKSLYCQTLNEYLSAYEKAFETALEQVAERIADQAAPLFNTNK